MYIPTIGLEIHAELKTKTKMFCRSANDPFNAEPNTHVCPVCMGHPGALPVINEEAVRHVLRVGIALEGQFADYTEFDRKNYFYADQPKGYQLSQYEYPLVSGGALHGVAITRVHLEEDTASSIHEEGVGTVVDYNRSGVPLMELVTEPVITSSKQAGDFARELQLLLRYLGASEANMEKGEMRVEANISISRDEKRGTKVEVKNLNSFRAMERAIEHEIKRQESLLARGENIVQETLGWDEAKQATFSQRAKEGSADYRYFPDPDLPSLRLSELAAFDAGTIRQTMPEIPAVRRARYMALGVKQQDADSFVKTRILGDFFEEVIRGHQDDRKWVSTASNYIANDLVPYLRDTESRDTEVSGEIQITPENFAKIIDLLSSGTVASSMAKDILARSVSGAMDPMLVAKESGYLVSISRSDLEKIVSDVLESNAAVVADYKAGKEAAIQYLVGMVMKSSKGKAVPQAARECILRLIAAHE